MVCKLVVADCPYTICTLCVSHKWGTPNHCFLFKLLNMTNVGWFVESLIAENLIHVMQILYFNMLCTVPISVIYLDNIYIYIYINVYIYIYVYIYVYIYICIHLYIYIYVCAHTTTHITIHIIISWYHIPLIKWDDKDLMVLDGHKAPAWGFEAWEVQADWKGPGENHRKPFGSHGYLGKSSIIIYYIIDEYFDGNPSMNIIYI